MKKFNLLLVGAPASIQTQVQKTLSKAFRRNFLFEVDDLPQAEKLLKKLNIDLLLVNSPVKPSILREWSKAFPKVRIIGIKGGKVSSPSIEKVNMSIISSEDLRKELLFELKMMRKERLEMAGQQGSRRRFMASAPNFRGYLDLLSSKA